MTEYATFFRPGEVTLLLETAEDPRTDLQAHTDALNELHGFLTTEFGIELHDTQFAGEAGSRPAAILRYCHDRTHIVHTVNLKSWISPERHRALESSSDVLQPGNADQPNDQLTPFQKALTDVLDVVSVLDDPNSLERLKKLRYAVIAATPNWLATPFQVN